jgi:competence protein ComFC
MSILAKVEKPVAIISTWLYAAKLPGQVLAWFFPFYCLGCGREDETICDSCLEKAPRLERQVCPYCRISMAGGRTCDFCVRGGAVLRGLLVASVYEKKGLIAKSLHNFKYNGQLDYGKALVAFMNKFLEQEAQPNEMVICPIPLFPEKQRSRGFNQSEGLAKGINLYGERINLLKRVSYEKAQMTLSGEERLANVKGVFECIRENLPGNLEKVLLIDDVATTLATLEEAARVLLDAGVKEVFGLVLARENFEIETKRL